MFDEMPEQELWDLTHSQDLGERSDALIELGQRKIQEEEWIMAKNLFGSAADILDGLDREVDLTRAIYSMGFCQYRLDEGEEAIQTLKIALKKSQDMGNARSVAYSAGPLADTFANLSYYEEAVEAYQIAVDAFEEIDDLFSAGINALAMGEVHGRNERQTRALEAFIRAFNVFQRSGDATGAARAKDRMASVLVDLDDLDQALMHMKDALHVFEHMENRERVAYMNYRIGKLLVLSEKYHHALEPLRTAIKYYRAESDWMNAAYAELSLANALRLIDPLEDNAESEMLFRRLSSFFEASGSITYSLVIQTMRGDKLADRGQLEAALAIFQDVVGRAIDIDDKDTLMSARTSVAELLFRLGRQTEGREVFAQVDAAHWGENKRELKRIESVTALMLIGLSNILNIDVAS
jgi:tetratricopeptide (TPR) repeat protein